MDVHVFESRCILKPSSLTLIKSMKKLGLASSPLTAQIPSIFLVLSLTSLAV